MRKVENHGRRKYLFSKKTQIMGQILELNNTSVCTNDKALYHRGSLAVDDTVG